MIRGIELIQRHQTDDPRFPSVEQLPFYVRDPKQTCATCQHLVRLRQSEADLEGVLTCKRSPPTVTSVLDQAGRIVGIAQSFVPQHPGIWCFQWSQRQKGNE